MFNVSRIFLALAVASISIGSSSCRMLQQSGGIFELNTVLEYDEYRSRSDDEVLHLVEGRSRSVASCQLSDSLAVQLLPIQVLADVENFREMWDWTAPGALGVYQTHRLHPQAGDRVHFETLGCTSGSPRVSNAAEPGSSGSYVPFIAAGSFGADYCEAVSTPGIPAPALSPCLGDEATAPVAEREPRAFTLVCFHTPGDDCFELDRRYTMRFHTSAGDGAEEDLKTDFRFIVSREDVGISFITGLVVLVSAVLLSAR